MPEQPRSPYRGVTKRAARIADEQEYGAHHASYRVNRAYDQEIAIGVMMLPVVAAVFLTMAWTATPWHGGHHDRWDRLTVTGVLVSGLAGLVCLVLTVWLAVPLLIGRFRARGAWVHVYEYGVIAERERGSLYAWPHKNATARFVAWDEPWDSGTRRRPQLWVTFLVDGEVICFDGRTGDDRAALSELAVALRAGEEPEEIGALRAMDAPVPF